MSSDSAAKAHFDRKRPGWFTKNIFNRLIAVLNGRGVSVLGSRVLEVKGRSSGQPRRTPVNLLDFDGERYLVAPRGETQWARNLRASGEGLLLVGKRSEPLHRDGGRGRSKGAGAARVPEALEVRGRRVLRRRRPRLIRR